MGLKFLSLNATFTFEALCHSLFLLSRLRIDSGGFKKGKYLNEEEEPYGM